MPGHETPLSKALTDCSISDLQYEMYPGIGNVIDDSGFRKWYVYYGLLWFTINYEGIAILDV